MTFVCVLVLAVNVHDAVPRWPWRLEGSRVGEQLFLMLLLLRSHVVVDDDGMCSSGVMLSL
eukprot:scaffold22798_cov101-Skeletonema_dohrnii-CCMP3373.AAC.1